MYVPAVERALSLIDQHGIYGLGDPDGCACTHFSICGFDVDVSCHKSEHCIRVPARGVRPEHAEMVAAKVLSELAKYYEGDREFWEKSPYRVRFCDYSHDHFKSGWIDNAWVDRYSCCYCGKERADREQYLCGECSGKENAKASFPWVADGFLLRAKLLSNVGLSEGGQRG